MYITNKIYNEDIRRIISSGWEKFKNTTFFITGASGLVGSFLIDTLMFLNKEFDYNIKIFATFTSIESFKSRFLTYQNDSLFNYVIQDITKPIELDEKIDYVVHCASNTHPTLYATKPVETISLNINGTLNVLNFAKKSNAKKVLCLSTLEVYGENKNVEKFSETDIGTVDFSKIRSCYPLSKILSENLCYGYSNEYDLDVSIARLGYIYGPTVKLNSSKADVQFLNKALNKEDIIMKSAGLQRRSYCYVADVISGILTILLKGKNNEAYNIASTKGNVQLKDYASTLANIAGVQIKFEELSELEKQGGSTVLNSTLDSSKLESLNWESKFSFKEGIEHTYKIKKEVLIKC